MPSSAGPSFLRYGCTGGFRSQKGLGLIWGEQTGFSCRVVLDDGVYTGCGDGSLGIKSPALHRWLKA